MAAAQDFKSYVSQYTTPEVFMENEAALAARIKFLDQLPEGAEAKIMTFVYENGEATRLLATHMCLAAKRGVNVQFIPDSKTGDRAGKADAFDADLNYKVNEEVYQMLANCGVKVRVHNHISDDQFQLLTLKPMAIPILPKNPLGNLNPTLGNAWALAVLTNDFKKIVTQQIQESFPTDKIAAAKGLEKTLITVGAVVLSSFIEAGDGDQQQTGLMLALDALKNNSETAGFASQFSTEQIKNFLYGVLAKVQADQRLGAFYRGIRLFNRLNHRKLFWVSYKDDQCMFVGGRNLGDHYLTWGRHEEEPSFMDADVLVCSQHLTADDQPVLQLAKASFEQLFNNQDLEDPLNIPVAFSEIKANLAYEFEYLLFPEKSIEAFQPVDEQKNLVPIRWGLSKSKAYADLKDEARLMPFPKVWESVAKISGEVISGGYDWNFLTTTWMRVKDQVRGELVKAIERETQQVYIETAYSEFNSELREKLEQKLKDGVKVDVVTNSIFVSDGGSKAIRLVMARWTRSMLETYPTLFNIKFAAIGFGHMIHFKGASFKCQLDEKTGEVFRFNLIGSHNFHGRSGYSDKEHALTWKQGPEADCAAENGVVASVDVDLQEHRNQYYKDLAVDAVSAPLKTFFTFEEEIQDAMDSGKLTDQRKRTAEWAMWVLYEHSLDANGQYVLVRDPKTGRAQLKEHNDMVLFLEILAESGVSDLIGTLL